VSIGCFAGTLLSAELISKSRQASRLLTLGGLLNNFRFGCTVKSTVRWRTTVGRTLSWKPASVKTFDYWGFVEHSLIGLLRQKDAWRWRRRARVSDTPIANLKTFDAWGWLSIFVEWTAASKARFAGALLSVELMRENRQASRVLTIEDSCGVSWLELQRQKYGSLAPHSWSD
jgi:hypothetical protein